MIDSRSVVSSLVRNRSPRQTGTTAIHEKSEKRLGHFTRVLNKRACIPEGSVTFEELRVNSLQMLGGVNLQLEPKRLDHSLVARDNMT